MHPIIARMDDEPETASIEVWDEPSSNELEVMRLIVSGMTDHTIARRLGISVITVRRRAASFRRRFGASTRIEAAVAAAKRGWL